MVTFVGMTEVSARIPYSSSGSPASVVAIGRPRSKNGAKNLSTVCMDVLKGISNTAHIPKYISWHSVIYLDTESSLGTFPDVSSTRLHILAIF